MTSIAIFLKWWCLLEFRLILISAGLLFGYDGHTLVGSISIWFLLLISSEIGASSLITVQSAFQNLLCAAVFGQHLLLIK